MKKIPSFTVDHIRLLRGIYVSRKDAVGDETVTTFDIRMKEPNREPCLSPSAIHTIEHLAATFLRNHPTWADKIIYWGPMGCLTGNYLVVKGDLQSTDIVGLMKETFRFITTFEGDVPGASPGRQPELSRIIFSEYKAPENRFLLCFRGLVLILT